ncbi:gamma-tubulin complex component 6 [Anopheles ziemanni]|uniref:gamma-tubulin complex component 6 n=1 Tax=Anopheles coustani TaxID=139045 RepID=UPI0026583846|nr:gamma-tubulin complex component 6 [Anopheles coustani]XP_058171033.1 gamma-tubulin complex component 6 [Anopheles ziemanni]
MHSDSVYRLVDELIGAIANQCRLEVGVKVTKKCKSLAFGILLGKQPAASIGMCQEPAPNSSTWDPLEMLECNHFEIQMTARYQHQVAQCNQFGDLLDEIRSKGTNLIDSDRALLLFLLSLKNAAKDDCYDVYVETPFFGHYKMPATRFGPYPVFHDEDFRIDDRLIASCYDAKTNPYLFRATNNIFTSIIADMIANESSRKDPLPVDCSYFSDEMANLGHYQGPFRYNLLKAIRRSNDNSTKLLAKFEFVQNCKPEEPVKKKEKMIFGLNWENLGQRYVPEEKALASECPGALLRLYGVDTKERHNMTRIVSREDFVRDVKFLITGVGSSLFHFDDTNRFQALPNITIENIRTESIKSLIDEALEIGTCFRRLHMMTRKNPYTLEMILDGFVFKAFCESVENFLCCYRVIVNGYTGHSLLRLLQLLTPANEQLLSMAKLCGIHPKNESDREFPTGSLLLDHLYSELIEVTHPGVYVFLLCTLRRCCLEYFAVFQRWLFEGQLHDPSGELFVYYVDNYRTNTKNFFDKAYLIRRQSVPGFLRGYEEDILLCGKYVMLLKAFRPLHPIFTLRQPELNVCLSFEDISQLQKRWLQYAAKARKLCGPAVSVRELYETRQRERDEFYRLVEANFRSFMDQWRVEQETEALELKRRKQKQMEDLLGQLNEIRATKLTAKRQELQEQLQLEHASLEGQNRELLQENYALTQRVRKYTELNRLMDDKLDGLKVAAAAMASSATEGTIIPVVTITTETSGGTDGGASDDGPFQSCRESITSATSVSIYEDAQKSPAQSVGSSPYGADSSSSTYSTSARCETAEADLSGASAEDLNCTIVEGPIVPLETTLPSALESDRLNSNVPLEVAVSEGERNRQRVLGSTLGTYLNEDHVNANVEEKRIVATASSGMRKLTEAQRNKLKILSHEFEIADPRMIDANCNLLEERRKNRDRILISDYTSREDDSVVPGSGELGSGQELTELQRNRRKIMSQEYNLLSDEPGLEVGQNRVELKQRPTMYLNLDSDRARNRRRILESEYNIATGTENFPGTPMSVGSETDVSPMVASTSADELESPLHVVNADVNANPVTAKIAPGLKLDVTRAAMEAADRFTANDKPFGIPGTAVLELETPASALKGASGDVTDGGFDFTRAKSLERRSGLDYSRALAAESTDNEEDEIYREFVEAMKKQCSNFCRLAIPPEDDWTVPGRQASDGLHKNELSSVDVLTITRFLQYSLVIPLKAHMEIVNNEILKMYLYDLNILAHFESLRNYFLLMDGEFSAHICDSLFFQLESVRTPEELLNYQTLHSILDGALYSSNAGKDRNADRVSFIVLKIPEKFDFYSPNVFGMLDLSYRVEWPLNLILTPDTIEQYTNVFKYLVKVRRVSYVLEDSFQLLKEASKRHGKPLLHSPQYARVQLVRHKLSQLVNALKNYITSSVLHASWETFRADLQDGTETMDDLYSKHRAYVKRIIFLCLLNKRSIEFYSNIEQIFRVVLHFYRHLRSKDWRPGSAKGGQNDVTAGPQYYVHPRYEQILDDERDFEKLIRCMIFLGNKMCNHGHQKEISEFLHVININGYYDDPAAASHQTC